MSMANDGVQRTSRFLKSVGVGLVAAALAAACSGNQEVDGSQSSTTAAPFATEVQPTTTSVVDVLPVDEPEVIDPLSGLSFDEPVLDTTPIAGNPNIRMGVLENGLTYFAQSNDNPGGSVSMRLVVNAGAVHEADAGSGVAHYLEHMLFNGTESYPGNELAAELRAIGVDFGPHLNAYTSDAETVYQLDVTDIGNNVETGLEVLAEWAAAATIDPDQVDAERGVVREELRVREETGDGRTSQRFVEAYHADTPFDGVRVAGTARSIEATTSQQLQSFYERWYRPENLAVIAVGDRSAEQLERAITEQFSPLEGPALPLATVALNGDAMQSEGLVDVIVEPGSANSYVSVDIPLPDWGHGTIGAIELTSTERLIAEVLNERIVEGVNSGSLDLRRGRASRFSVNRQLNYFGFNIDANDLVDGTETLMSELWNAVRHRPFTQSELDRARNELMSRQEQRLAQAGSIQDNTLARKLVSHSLVGSDVAPVDESVAQTIEVLEGVSLDELNNYFGWVMTTSNPIVIAVGPDEEVAGTVVAHSASMERARNAEARDAVSDLTEIQQLLDIPESVNEIERRSLSSIEGTLLKFENGSTVLIAESDIVQGRAYLLTTSPGGLMATDPELASTIAIADRAVSLSGVGPWNSSQLRRYLRDRDVNIRTSIEEVTEGFTGSAAVTDLELMFQLLHLQILEPRIDDVQLSQAREGIRDFIEQTGLNSSLAADMTLAEERLGRPLFHATDADLAAITADEALAIYSDRLTAIDDHVIAIVGDFDIDAVVTLARTYVGSIAVVNGVEEPADLPSPGLVQRRLSVGSGDESGAYRLNTIAAADATLENQVTARVAELLLHDRFAEGVRETLGATYGGNVRIEFTEASGVVDMTIMIDGDPDRIDEIATVVEDEMAALGSGSITSRDFNEAVAVFEDELNFINNGYLMEAMIAEARGTAVLTRDAQWRTLTSLNSADVAAFIELLDSDADRIDIRNVPAR